MIIRYSQVAQLSHQYQLSLSCVDFALAGYENGRKKRDAGYADGVMYDQYFPGYPSGLRMREDVANFVS